MNTVYKVVFSREGSYYPLTLKQVMQWVYDVSFQKKGVFGHVAERIDDGTLGTPWVDSINLNFKVNVKANHVSTNPDTVYCIDGKLVAGYEHAVKYVAEQLNISKTDASYLVINL